MLPGKKLSKEQALQKIQQYCTYQERCHSEVKEKLYTYGLRKADTEELISFLIENNYLNEERFAIQYAGGKFRIKHWGRKKIQYELQQKQVSSYNIKSALKEIGTEQYTATLIKLAETKWQSLTGESFLSRQVKTSNYLLQKGYELTLISETIKNLVLSNKKQ